MSKVTSHTDELFKVIDELGEQEQSILLRVARRLRAGQDSFGVFRLETDDRNRADWLREAHEEALDASIYLSAVIEQMRLVAAKVSDGNQG